MTHLLVIGISMALGGTEKAMISFLSGLDPARYRITLLLACHDGPLMTEIPPHVRLLPPMRNGILFTLSRRNVATVLQKLSFPGKRTFLSRHATLVTETLKGAVGAADRLFIALMREALPLFSEEYPDETFDAVLAFPGDRTMFYLCDKVCCRRKIAWLHFDYRHPVRDDALYGSYFARCHAVLSVSDACTALLRKRFPGLSSRFHTLYNRLPIDEIRRLAREPCPWFPPTSHRFRLLSVMRLCPQKGVDMIPPVLKHLSDMGIPVDWYVAGGGHTADVRALKRAAVRYGVSDRLILLGPLSNPYPLMARCDLFVLPSRFEGLPITVEEAKLLRTPFLCTRYLSAREQTENGRIGALCRCSPTSLAAAIAALLLCEDLRLAYRKRLAERPPVRPDLNDEWEKILATCEQSVNCSVSTCAKRKPMV